MTERINFLSAVSSRGNLCNVITTSNTANPDPLRDGTDIATQEVPGPPPQNKFYDENVVRDCILLSSSSYKGLYSQVAANLSTQHHRFTNIFVSKIAESDGHFLFAETKTLSNNPKIPPLTTVYVAVRGSVTFDDWKANATFLPTLASNHSFVHSGWYSRCEQVPIGYLFDRLMEGCDIVITGHSLGGAVAQLVTQSLLNKLSLYIDRGIIKKIKCVTFGAPLVFNKAAAEQLNEDEYRSCFIHFVAKYDIVPKLVSWCQGLITSLLTTPENDAAKSRVPTNFKLARDCLAALTTALSEEPLMTGSETPFWMACKALTKINVVNNLSPIIISLFSYKPVGYYFIIEGDIYEPLTNADMEEHLSYNNFQLSPDLLVYHDMTNRYGGFILGGLLIIKSLYTDNIPPNMNTLPIPEIKSIEVKSIPKSKKVNVHIKGRHLYMLKTIVSADLSICKLENYCIDFSSDFTNGENITINTTLHESFLKKVTQSLKIDYTSLPFSNSRISVRPLIEVRVLKFLDSSVTVIPNIAVESDYHSFDDCSLQELMVVSFFLLSLKQKGEDSAAAGSTHEQNPSLHPPIEIKFDELRKLLIEIMNTLPLKQLFTAGNSFAGLVLQDIDIAKAAWISSPAVRDAMEKFTFNANNNSDNQTQQIDILETMESNLKAVKKSTIVESYRKEDEKCSYFEVEPSIADIIGREQVIDSVLKLITTPLEQAKIALQEERSKPTLNAYVTNLTVSLKLANFFGRTFGIYYDKNQKETGSVQIALENLFANRHVQNILKGAQGISIITLGGSLIYGAYILAIGASVSFVGVAVAGVVASAAIAKGVYDSEGSFPSSLLDSSKGLRRGIAEKIEFSLTEYTSMGQQEMELAEDLRRTHKLDENKSVKEYLEFLKRFYEYNCDKRPDDAEDIARRLKLLVLSSKLRQSLKYLPIVLLTGATTSGKSTLREKLIHPGNVDRNAFGECQSNRTAIPEIFVCQGTSDERSFCILDTIGTGDSSLGIDAQQSLMSVNAVFKSFVSAVIIIAPHDDDGRNDLVSQQLFITSKSPSPSNIFVDKTVHCPTLTCFNKADRILHGKNVQEYESILKKEAEDRCRVGRPFDLQSIEENAYLPRVFTCFNLMTTLVSIPPVNVKERCKHVLITEKEVQYWVEYIFYGENKRKVDNNSNIQNNRLGLEHNNNNNNNKWNYDQIIKLLHVVVLLLAILAFLKHLCF